VDGHNFKLELVRVHLCSLLALYVARGSPAFNLKLLVSNPTEKLVLY